MVGTSSRSVHATLGATGTRVNAAARPIAEKAAANETCSGLTRVDGHSTTTVIAIVAASVTTTLGRSSQSLVIVATAAIHGRTGGSRRAPHVLGAWAVVPMPGTAIRRRTPDPRGSCTILLPVSENERGGLLGTCNVVAVMSIRDKTDLPFVPMPEGL